MLNVKTGIELEAWFKLGLAKCSERENDEFRNKAVFVS